MPPERVVVYVIRLFFRSFVVPSARRRPDLSSKHDPFSAPYFAACLRIFVARLCSSPNQVDVCLTRYARHVIRRRAADARWLLSFRGVCSTHAVHAAHREPTILLPCFLYAYYRPDQSATRRRVMPQTF